MENMLQNALRYVIGVVVFLVMVALYFFILADQTLRSDQDFVVKALDENKSLALQNKDLEAQVSDFETQLKTLKDSVAEKQTTIDNLQQAEGIQDLTAQCEALPPSEKVLSIQNKLIETQNEQIACSTTLSARNADLESLRQTIESLEARNNELLASRDTGEQFSDQVEQLQSDLEQAGLDNENLLAQVTDLQSQLAAQNNATPEPADNSTLIAELATVTEENKLLRDQLKNLENEKAERPTSIISSNELQFTDFKATPNFCDTEFDGDAVCMTSIDIVATFNFNPNGFISIRLIDPQGDTVDRKNVAGRTVNRVSFELDSDEPSLVGDYRVEFKIDDVFNKFNTTQQFTVTPTGVFAQE